MSYHNNNYNNPTTPVTTSSTSVENTTPSSNPVVSNVITKMGYSINDFKLSGVEYTGYFNIRDDGSVFTGKFDTDEILTPFDNVRGEIYLNNNLYFDRTLTDKLALPYSEKEIQFAPNELINRNSLNSKIEYLYDNFLELYRFSVISLPKLPLNESYFASASTNPNVSATTSSDVVWLQNTTTHKYKTTDLQPFTEYNNAFTGQNESLNIFYNHLSASATLFASVSNVIFTYEIDRNRVNTPHTSFNFVFSATNFGNFNELTFEHINNTTDDGDKLLFVADDIKNTIYKFDVSSIVDTDRTGQKTFKLLDSMGGTALTGKDYNFSFNNLDDIEFVNDHLYTYDSGFNEFKIFTKEFAFKNRYKNDSYFKANPVVSYKINPFDKKLYILSQNFKVLVLNSTTFEVLANYTIKPSRLISVNAKEIIFSKNDSNIYYLLTTSGVYKGFVSRMKDGEATFIARLVIKPDAAFVLHWEEYVTDAADEDHWENKINEWQVHPSIAPLAGTNLSMESNYEKLWFITDKVFLELTENSGYVDITNSSTPYFTRNQIKIDDDYFNAFSLNRSFYNLLYNCNLLSKNINKFLTATYVQQELIFNTFSNILPDVTESTKLLDQNEIFIGNNETINIDVFNRTIGKLYDYQKLLLSAYAVEIFGTRLPPLSTVPLE
jgi:hypothetical protein